MSQQQYLDAMGITRWQRRDTPLPACTENNQVLDEAPLSVAKPEATPVEVTQLSWAQMDAAVMGCQHCLHAESKQKRLGCGHSNADVMFIVAAEESALLSSEGYFSAGAQRLFDNMLRTIGLSSPQIYLTAAVKCSPSGDPPWDADAAVRCAGYLVRQVALLKPKVVVALGASTVQVLKNTKQMADSVGDEPLSYGEEKIPLLVIHSPEHLLKKPLDKRQAWKDLNILSQRLKTA